MRRASLAVILKLVGIEAGPVSNIPVTAETPMSEFGFLNVDRLYIPIQGAEGQFVLPIAGDLVDMNKSEMRSRAPITHFVVLPCYTHGSGMHCFWDRELTWLLQILTQHLGPCA